MKVHYAPHGVPTCDPEILTRRTRISDTMPAVTCPQCLAHGTPRLAARTAKRQAKLAAAEAKKAAARTETYITALPYALAHSDDSQPGNIEP